MNIKANIDGNILKFCAEGRYYTMEFHPGGTWQKLDKDHFHCHAEDWEWSISAETGIHVTCRHTGCSLPGNTPECILEPLDADAAWRMLIHHPVFGYFRSGISRTNPEDDFFGAHELTESPLFTLLYAPVQKHGVFAGFLPPVRDDSLFVFKEGKLFCRFFQTAPQKAGIALDTLRLEFGNDPVSMLTHYADSMPQMRNSLKNKVIKGWNSWDYYFQTVTEEDIEENLNALKTCPEIASELEYIIIDDGWQNGYGDWEVSSRFHGRLEKIVEKIRYAGYKPGLWVAPFIADYYSKLSLRHPEMLAKNSSGKYDFAPGGNGGLGTVDPTHPESEIMLKRLFSRLRELGFEYFKVDFVKYLMAQSQFYNSSRRLDMVEHGMRIIREAVGPDAVLAGCGMPVYGGYGIVDSMRIAGDISTFWSNVLSSARELSATFFLNRKAWINDSDFLLVRSPQTTDEKHYNPFFLPKSYQPFESRSGEAIATLNETQVWCSMVILSGGNVILGDRFAALNETGKKLIRTVLKYVSSVPGVPLDLFESGIPSKWVRQDAGKKLFAFFNWEDREKEVIQKLAETPCHGCNIWSEKRFDLPKGIFHEIIPPRTVRMMEIFQNT